MFGLETIGGALSDSWDFLSDSFDWVGGGIDDLFSSPGGSEFPSSLQSVIPDADTSFLDEISSAANPDNISWDGLMNYGSGSDSWGLGSLGSSSGGSGGFFSDLYNSSFWDSKLGSALVSPTTIQLGATGIYSALQGKKTEKLQKEALAREEARYRERDRLDRLKMAADLTITQWRANRDAASGGGAGSSAAMINALTNAANSKIQALNNLSNAYSNASMIRRRRY